MYSHIQNVNYKIPKIKITLFLFFIFVFSFFLFPVNAQENTNNEMNERDVRRPSLSIPGGTSSNLQIAKGKKANCSQYYDFGSVKFNFTLDRAQYKSGDPVVFDGEIRNTNPYPLTDLDIVARVFKTYEDSNERADTIFLDQYTVKEGINIAGKATKDITGTWTVPLTSTGSGGQYFINLYAVEKNRFNISGLSFSEDMYGSQLEFTIEGSNNYTKPYIDRGQIEINGKKHDTKGFLTRNSDQKPINITFPVVNNTEKEKEVKITYSLYVWDSQNKDHKLKTFKENIKVNPNTRKSLKYTIDSPQEPVYLARFTTQVDKNKTSMASIRLAVNKQDKPRINAAGVSDFPVQKDSKIFLCLHNMNKGAVSVNAVATLTDIESGDTLSQIKLSGDISSQIQGFTNTISTNTAVDKAKLSIELNSQGEQIDAVEMTYSCEQLDSVPCSSAEKTIFSNRIVVIFSVLGIMGLLGLGVGSIYIYKQKNKSE